MKYIYIIILLCIVISGCSDKKELRGWDVELFSDTELYSLAKDLEDGDTSNVFKYRHLLNIQESNFGFTLLHWSTFRNDIKSCVSLLNNGANPNVLNHKKMTPLFYSTYPSCSFEILKVLVDKGSLPNLESNDPHYLTPLIGAASSSLEKTKYLVQNNANVRFYKIDVDYRQDTTITDALGCSLLMKKLEISRYLIIECNADYEKIWSVSWDGYIWDICGALDQKQFKQGTLNWYTKREILDSLKSWGHDCNQIMNERLEANKKR